MIEIRADRRSQTAFPDAERRGALLDDVRVYLEAKVRLARRLVEAEWAREHALAGYANIRDYARQVLRVPGPDVSILLDPARSCSIWGGRWRWRSDRATALGVGSWSTGHAPTGHAPTGHAPTGHAPTGMAAGTRAADEPSAPETVADRIAAGALSIENAAELGRLAREGGPIDEAARDRWVERAETVDPRQFRRDVRKHVESVRQAERTRTMTLEVTESAQDEFHRARELASRRAQRNLSAGETFAVVVRRFLRDEDPRESGTKPRRVPDTSTVPRMTTFKRSRYVPAEVQREIRRRADDRCEVPGCSNGIFLELMHVAVSHAAGGAREVRSLALGCTAHHLLLDAGVIRFDGWADDGHPRFVGPNGRRMAATPSAVPPAHAALASARPASVRPAGARDGGAADATTTLIRSGESLGSTRRFDKARAARGPP